MNTSSIGDPLDSLTLQQLKLPFLEEPPTPSSIQWKSSRDLIVKLSDTIWGRIFDIFRNQHPASDQYIVQESMLYFIRALPNENELEDLLATNSSTYNGYQKCYHNILKVVIRTIYSESGIFASGNSRSVSPLWRPLFKATRYGVSQTVIHLATTMICLPVRATRIANGSFYHFTELRKAVIEFRTHDAIYPKRIAKVLLAPKLKELKFHSCDVMPLYSSLKILKNVLKSLQDRIQDPDQKVHITLSSNYNEISDKDLNNVLMNMDTLPVDSIEIMASKENLTAAVVLEFLNKFNTLSSFKCDAVKYEGEFLNLFSSQSISEELELNPQPKNLAALIHFINSCDPLTLSNYLPELLENLDKLFFYPKVKKGWVTKRSEEEIAIAKQLCEALTLIIEYGLDKTYNVAISKALKSFLDKEISLEGGVLKISLSVLVSDFFQKNKEEWINLKEYVKTLGASLEIICSEEMDLNITFEGVTKKLDFWDCIRLFDFGSSLKAVHFCDIKDSYDFVKDTKKIKRFAEDHPDLQVLDIFFPCQFQGIVIDRPSVIEWYRTNTDLITSCTAIRNAAALHEIVHEHTSSSTQNILTHLLSGTPPIYEPTAIEEILETEMVPLLQTTINIENGVRFAEVASIMLCNGVDFEQNLCVKISLEFLLNDFFGFNGPSVDLKYYIQKLGLLLNVICTPKSKYTLSYKPKKSDDYVHLNLGKEEISEFVSIIRLLGFFPLLNRLTVREFDKGAGEILTLTPADLCVIGALNRLPRFYALDIFSACESNGVSRKEAIEWHLANTTLIKECWIIQNAIRKDEKIWISKEKIIWYLAQCRDEACGTCWGSLNSSLEDVIFLISEYENLQIESSAYYSAYAIGVLIKITDIIIKNKIEIVNTYSEAEYSGIVQGIVIIIRKLTRHDATLFEQIVAQLRTLEGDNAVYQALAPRNSSK